MGQRHQAFLIAKIKPYGESNAKYRCVAAMHHQWCYGSLPLRAARRLLTLLKKPENATIVMEELRALDGKYGRWRVPPKTPKLPPIPCPYSSFLLLSAFNFDLCDDPDKTYLGSSFSPLDANMGSFEGDNNDGLTIVDITDPRNPAYCFVVSKTLLTATEYVRKYYPVPEPGEKNVHARPEEVVLEAIADLEGETLVNPQMLAEAWPAEYPKHSERKDENQKSELNSGTVPAASQIPPLSDLALKPTIVHALETDDMKDIEQLIWLPGKAQIMIEVLKSYEKPLPDSGVSLLAQIINHLNPENVDISSFSLSGPQVVALLSDTSNVEVLDLSHNHLVTADTVRSILKSTPTLKRLVLLDTSVTDEDLSSLLRDDQKLFSNLEALTHPLLLQASSTEYPNAFAIITQSEGYGFRGMTGLCFTGATIPFFTPSFIVQALTDYLHACMHCDYLYLRNSIMYPVSRVILSSTARKTTETWATRTVPMIASSSLASAIRGEGWIFAVEEDGLYGFIEAKSGDIEPTSASSSSNEKELNCVQRVLDLEDFLKEIQNQGCPPAPASAVDDLCVLVQRFCSSFKLMTMSDANHFIGESRKYQANQNVQSEMSYFLSFA